VHRAFIGVDCQLVISIREAEFPRSPQGSDKDGTAKTRLDNFERRFMA